MDTDTAIDTIHSVDFHPFFAFHSDKRRTLKIIQTIIAAVAVRGDLHGLRIVVKLPGTLNKAGMTGDDNSDSAIFSLCVCPSLLQ